MTKQLPAEWSRFLLSQPETGMGLQVVSVTLRDGRIVDDVAIIEANTIGEVRGYDDVPFDSNDVVAIEVTHRRWKFLR